MNQLEHFDSDVVSDADVSLELENSVVLATPKNKCIDFQVVGNVLDDAVVNEESNNNNNNNNNEDDDASIRSRDTLLLLPAADVELVDEPLCLLVPALSMSTNAESSIPQADVIDHYSDSLVVVNELSIVTRKRSPDFEIIDWQESSEELKYFRRDMEGELQIRGFPHHHCLLFTGEHPTNLVSIFTIIN